MKRIIIGIAAVIAWVACVIPFALGASQNTESGHDFTVLAIKEDNVKDYNSMPVFLDLAEETGTDVYWTFNTSTQYANNPDPVGINGIDAIYHSGFSNLRLYNYGRRGSILAIDEYLSYMPNFSAILESRPDIAEALKSPDGHIYSLPRVEEMGLKAYPNILFLNKKWMEKLIDSNELPAGLELEKSDLVDGLDLSRDEFKAILQKFNDLDMDGDGDNESDLIASFGVPENREHKTIVNGEVVFTIEDENWYNAIVELNDWYNRGLIRSASFTQTQDNFLARGQDGRYGAFYWWEKETVVSEPDDYIIVLPLSDENGRRYVGVSNELEVEKGECVILSSCEDPEELLAYFDKFFEPEYSAQLNYGSIESGAFLRGRDEQGRLVPNDDHGEQSADDLERYVKPYTYEGAEGIPNLNYTAEELNELNIYESSLTNNILNWMTTAIISAGAPSYESWQSFLNENRNSIDAVKRINQAAYDRYAEAVETAGQE